MRIRKHILTVFSSLMRGVCKPKVVNNNPDMIDMTVSKPCIMISNHTSITNGPLLMSLLRGPIVPVVAEDWYQRKEWKRWLDTIGCIPCHRQGIDTAWLKAAAVAIADGKSILVFPEGKVRKDGVCNEYKAGFALLSAMTGAPVIPITICNQYSIFHPAKIVIDPAVTIDRSQAHNGQYLASRSAELRELTEKNKCRYGNRRSCK